MLGKDKRSRDPSSLGLAGVRTVGSFAAVPVISHDCLRQDIDSRDSDKPNKRLWLSKRYRVA